MATTLHSALASAEVHEPKHITSYSTGDSGKVITNSSTVTGTSEYRALTQADITEKDVYLTVDMTDIAVPGSVWLVSPITGTVTKIYSVIDGAPDADVAITPQIGGTPLTSGGITIATAGAAAGDVDSSTPSAANAITAGQALEIETDGAGATTVKATFIVTIRES